MEKVGLNDAIVVVNEVILGFKRRIEELEYQNAKLKETIDKLNEGKKED